MLATRVTISTYSCICSQLVFMRLNADLCGIFHKLARLAANLEPSTQRESQIRMRGSAVLNARLMCFFYIYGLASVAFLTMLFLYIKPLWIEETASAVMRLFGDSDVDLSCLEWSLRLAWLPVQSCMVAVWTNSFLCLIGCMIFIYATCADLFEAIGRSVEQGHCSRITYALLQGVLDVLLRLDDTFADVLPHLLVVSVVLPLLSTVELATRGTEADAFALLNAPLIFAVFVPICFAGDRLSVARSGMSRSAFYGPWLEESQRCKKLRLALMHVADGRGAQVRGSGIGLLNRRACGKALKSWFSFLQVLVNVKRRNAATVK
ncbi:uncharacterized protein LOC127750862 [Frankliniella occidentalis]|uniref:Uncharacterized protein LOC127750862 n=1 Tax=Frankliniella occidentalis TaxID=133901 RepID=A0A9C6X5A1_FRAOC|nr:uncharacterized protein LOC127750862 [Frankliniella occidentalis]